MRVRYVSFAANFQFGVFATFIFLACVVLLIGAVLTNILFAIQTEFHRATFIAIAFPATDANSDFFCIFHLIHTFLTIRNTITIKAVSQWITYIAIVFVASLAESNRATFLARFPVTLVTRVNLIAIFAKAAETFIASFNKFAIRAHFIPAVVTNSDSRSTTLTKRPFTSRTDTRKLFAKRFDAWPTMMSEALVAS